MELFVVHCTYYTPTFTVLSMMLKITIILSILKDNLSMIRKKMLIDERYASLPAYTSYEYTGVQEFSLYPLRLDYTI